MWGAKTLDWDGDQVHDIGLHWAIKLFWNEGWPCHKTQNLRGVPLKPTLPPSNQSQKVKLKPSIFPVQCDHWFNWAIDRRRMKKNRRNCTGGSWQSVFSGSWIWMKPNNRWLCESAKEKPGRQSSHCSWPQRRSMAVDCTGNSKDAQPGDYSDWCTSRKARWWRQCMHRHL